MEIITDFLNSLNKYMIATEADDITGDISSQTDDIMGNTGDDAENTGEISTDTDDILGTKSDNPDDNANMDEETPDDNQEDPLNDPGSEDIDSLNEENPTDDLNTENTDEPMQQEDDPFTESRKKKIKKQFMHLYDVIDDSVKLISTYNPNIVDTNYIHVLSSIKDNLTQCKEIIYNLAVNEFQNVEYHELLKKYVAINRIYEISTKTLEKYFEKYKKDNESNTKQNA